MSTNNLLLDWMGNGIQKLFGTSKPATRWKPETKQGKKYWAATEAYVPQPTKSPADNKTVLAYIKKSAKQHGILQVGAIYRGTVDELGMLTITRKGLIHKFKEGEYQLTEKQ